MDTYEDLIKELEKASRELEYAKKALKRRGTPNLVSRLRGFSTSTDPQSRYEKAITNYDSLMLMYIQHNLLSYIKQGGIPIIYYYPSSNLYTLSIPGLPYIAKVTPQGFQLIKEYALEHDNPEATKCICTKDAKQSNKSREGG